MQEKYPFCMQIKDGVWRLMIRVQPKAKRNEVVGLYDQRLKIRVQAPPVDDKANSAVCSFIARELGLRKNQVSIESGQTTRQKNILIEAATEPDWDRLLREG
jgi:uncharacterized protein (TIGR00251 family)